MDNNDGFMQFRSDADPQLVTEYQEDVRELLQYLVGGVWMLVAVGLIYTGLQIKSNHRYGFFGLAAGLVLNSFFINWGLY